jgi:hypothetical protein
MLVVAEADEVFMDNQDKEWDCGSSPGEGLSRVLSTELYPHEQNGFVTGPSWLRSDRPDFVSDSDGTDQNFVSIGCATLFINYLRHQLGFNLYQITVPALRKLMVGLPRPAREQLRAILAGAVEGMARVAANYQQIADQSAAIAKELERPAPTAARP